MYLMFHAAIALFQLVIISKYASGHTGLLETRQLQTVQTLNYRATYRADFQHVLDPSCNGISPIIGVQCLGANMTILSTSDSSIGCSKVEGPTVEGSLYACVTDCSDDECDDVYLASNASTFFDGPFGSVTFMCEGDDYRNVTATFLYLDENTTCGSSTVATRTRNYHAGRLGVSCPVDSSREYVFEDSYFECVSFVPPITTQAGSEDAYTCISGKDCLGAECNVTIDIITFLSDVPTFFDTCVEKTTNVTIASPTLSPAVSSFKYTAQFEANWAVLYDSETALISCTNALGGAVLSCDNGSFISYLSSSDASMNCIMLNDSELSCIGSAEGVNNQFTRVNYECTGPNTPSSRVTFLQSDAVCTLVQETVTVSHAVALGVTCTFGNIYFDTYTECASASHQFNSGTGDFNFPLDYVFCSESASFSLGTSTTPQIISNVTIRTDNYWLSLTDRRCVTIAPANQESPISSAPVSVPVPPTPFPTNFPIQVLSTLPTAQPSMIPIMSREILPSNSTSKSLSPASITMDESTEENKSDGENATLIGIVVGCIVAGFLVTAVFGYFVLFRKRESNVPTSKALLTVTDVLPTENEGNDNVSPTPQAQQRDAEPVAANVVATIAPTAYASAPPVERRLTSSTEYLPDMKDQCRSVVMIPNQNRTTPRPSISESTENDNIPMVTAYGVLATSVASNNSKEPPGRQFMDM